jgi:hypothetical protein
MKHVMLSVVILSVMLSVVMLSVVMLSVMLIVGMPNDIMLSVFMLSVGMPYDIMLSVFMLSIVMPNDIMLSVLMLSIVILNVAAPFAHRSTERSIPGSPTGSKPVQDEFVYGNTARSLIRGQCYKTFLFAMFEFSE